MILRFWRWLWGGCDHRWTILTKSNLFNDENGKGLPHGCKYHLQCAKCGVLTFKKL